MSPNELFLFLILETVLLVGLPLAVCGFAKLFKLGLFSETKDEPAATAQKA